MSEQRLSDEEIATIDARVRLAGGSTFSASPARTIEIEEARAAGWCDAGRLIRDLRQARADLAAETATRTALRTQEARVSGLLADAGVPVGDIVAGVASLVAERDAARYVEQRRVSQAERDLAEMRGARDRLLAEVDRLRALVPTRCPGKSAGGHAWRDDRCEFCGQGAPR